MAELLNLNTDQMLPIIKYNKFFNPNVCHVCKSTSQEDLLTCPSCRMITYCSKLHQAMHLNEHSQICDIIIKTNLTMKNMQCSTGLMDSQWVAFKMANIQNITQQLHRDLLPYEEQMFLYPKSCLVCHTQKDVTTVCERCFSVNVCSKHKLHNYSHDCFFLRICLDTDKICANGDQYRDIPELLPLMEIIPLFEMGSLVATLLRNGKENASWSFTHIIYSDVLSELFTLFYGLKLTNLINNSSLSKEFVIHIVVDVDIMDLWNLSLWELLLHVPGMSNKITVIIVGTTISRNEFNFIDVCEECTKCGRELNYNCLFMFYHEYTRSAVYKKPHVVVVFDVEFEKGGRPKKLITALCDQQCPVIITAKSESKALRIIDLIRKKLVPGPVKPMFYAKNRFASLRPYRDYDGCSVYFPHERIIIYRNLIDTNITDLDARNLINDSNRSITSSL
ncbi:uncharacterized protein LOC105188740 [Harpegnathos saltator]|uniref:MYND-type domain-containing protein n=1 Tax=Harpegnathos saltator TaxID=610380 RepID=E2C0V3_HARSA|nr:uncharacterized protein LOC105188740 [Harpegnathos saltator]EFN78389.1 hypothetical protein EAI_13658 [Harpegnathos saltator]